MASWRRRASRPILATSTPSSSTLPAVTSISRNSASMSEDLPLPVRPTTPKLVPPWSNVRYYEGHHTYG